MKERKESPVSTLFSVSFTPLWSNTNHGKGETRHSARA